jgi:hypothetical protein
MLSNVVRPLLTKVLSFLAKMTNDEPLNLRPKSQEVLRQTGFETTFTGRGHGSQSRGKSAKPRSVRGSWQIESLHSKSEEDTFDRFIRNGQFPNRN